MFLETYSPGDSESESESESESDIPPKQLFASTPKRALPVEPGEDDRGKKAKPSSVSKSTKPATVPKPTKPAKEPASKAMRSVSKTKPASKEPATKPIQRTSVKSRPPVEAPIQAPIQASVVAPAAAPAAAPVIGNIFNFVKILNIIFLLSTRSSHDPKRYGKVYERHGRE